MAGKIISLLSSDDDFDLLEKTPPSKPRTASTRLATSTSHTNGPDHESLEVSLISSDDLPDSLENYTSNASGGKRLYVSRAPSVPSVPSGHSLSLGKSKGNSVAIAPYLRDSNYIDITLASSAKANDNAKLESKTKKVTVKGSEYIEVHSPDCQTSFASRKSPVVHTGTINPAPRKRLLGENGNYGQQWEMDSDDPFASSPPRKRRATPEPHLPKPLMQGRSRSPVRSMSKAGPAAYNHSSVSIEVPSKAGAIVVGASKKNITSDPLEFTSDPDYLADAARRKRQAKKHGSGDNEDEFQVAGKEKAFFESSESDSDDLEDIQEMLDRAKTNPEKFIAKAIAMSNSTDNPMAHAVMKVKAPERREAVRKGAKEEQIDNKLAAKLKRDAAKAARDAAKESEREEKKKAKEEKAKEKEMATELAKVNTLRTDKKVSIKEMIVELPALDKKGTIMNIFAKLLEDTGADLKKLDGEEPVVKWKRKVNANYNEDADRWEPAPRRIVDEKHILYYMAASEFVKHVTDEENSIDMQVVKLQSRFPKYTIIYLIQGMHTWMAANRKIKQREYDAAVRSHAEALQPNQSKPGKAAAKHVDEDMVHEALLRLQMVHKVLIHDTASLAESGEAIFTFTEQISLKPHRIKSYELDSAFCMDAGQVTTGIDASDTFIKMLEVMKGIANGHSRAIAGEYGTVQELVQAFERRGGEGAVAELRKEQNRTGGFSDTAIGPAVSKRLFKIFTGTDPLSSDI